MSIDKNNTSVQAIDRAFLVLETISNERAISLNDLHSRLGLNKASLSRIVSTLLSNGYLEKNLKSGEFSLSLKTFELGIRAVNNLDYINLIKGFLAELSSKFDVIAQFSVEDNNELLCLESIDPKDQGFSIYTRVGQRSGLYCTSAGKAIMSTYSNEEIMQKWNDLNIMTLTKNTITDIQEFLQEIAKTRQRNYALDMEESEYGLFCIGTTVLNYNKKPIGAISLSFNTFNEEKLNEYSTGLLECTQRLSKLMGYSIS